MKTGDFDWTDEAIAELRQHHADGLSTSLIAEAMRRPGQRNSIIGKLTRLGITRDDRPPARKVKPSPKHRPVKRAPPPPPEPMPAPDVDDSNIPFTQLCTLMQLTNETCRWPVSGADYTLYCGHRSADLAAGQPYCKSHSDRALAGKGRA